MFLERLALRLKMTPSSQQRGDPQHQSQEVVSRLVQPYNEACFGPPNGIDMQTRMTQTKALSQSQQDAKETFLSSRLLGISARARVAMARDILAAFLAGDPWLHDVNATETFPFVGITQLGKSDKDEKEFFSGLSAWDSTMRLRRLGRILTQVLAQKAIGPSQAELDRAESASRRNNVVQENKAFVEQLEELRPMLGDQAHDAVHRCFYSDFLSVKRLSFHLFRQEIDERVGIPLSTRAYTLMPLYEEEDPDPWIY